MKLSLYEQETIILYNQAEATAEVYTHDPKLLEKLRVREPYSAERRKAASERAKAAGYRPPVPKAGGK